MVLVLNLLFWLVVILWRVYILKRARDQIRRQRRHIEGVTNPSLSACEAAPAPRETRERPYVLATPRNELPPSYDEAIKYPSIHLTPTLSFALEQTSRDAATTERTRPPVPPRPSLLRAGGSNDHAENTPANADNGDDTVLPTYEELQSRMATPHAEILLTVHNSHARNFSA